MKKITTIFSCLLFTLFLSGQTVSVSADKMNVFYNGLVNPLRVVVENQDCNNIIVKTTKGKIKGENCKYTYTFVDSTLNSTSTKIFIGLKNKKKINWIDSVEFRIKKIPDPIPSINWNMITMIRDHGLEHYRKDSWDENLNLGIINRMINFDFDIVIPVIQYSIKIVRHDSVLYEIKQINGNKISKNIIEEYLIAGKTGDKVIIYDIFSKTPDGSIIKFEKLEYKLK